MLKSKILLLTTLLGFSISSFGAYFPDLFGAGMRGAEQARQDNARDAYYYQQVNQPKLFIEVYDGITGKLKKNMNASLQKEDSVCWVVYPLPAGQTYYAVELLTLPIKQATSARHYHDSDQLTKTVEINPAQFGVYSHSVGFLNEMKPTKSQIGSCWKFTLPSTPKGQYFLNIKVGEKDFGTGRFNIIN